MYVVENHIKLICDVRSPMHGNVVFVFSNFTSIQKNGAFHA